MIKRYTIPTILGITILTIGLISGVVLVQNNSNLLGFAQTNIKPEELKITNLTDSSFTVSWTTQKEAVGFVSYGEASSLGSTTNDDRDKTTSKTGNYFVHYVTLTSLKPSTKYYFKIGSSNRLYDNQGSPYTQTTGPTITNNPPLADLAYGTVIKPDGQPENEAIVYFSIAGITPLSALVKDSGKWTITLSNARTSDLKDYARYDSKTQPEEIFIRAGTNGVASAITNTANDQPVPEIILGKTYDFRAQNTGSTPTPTATQSSEISPTSSPSKFSVQQLPFPTESDEITIINPADGENISTLKPEFFGTGPAGKTIQIKIESSKTYNAKVKVGDSNRWQWAVPANLTPGSHKLTVTYLGKTIQRSFTVLAAGNLQPAFTATPSATATTKPTSTPSSSPTPTKKQPTPTPTAKAESTLTPTPTVTVVRNTPTSASSSRPRTSMPATESGIPRAGDFSPMILVTFFSLLLIITSFILKLYWPIRNK